MSNDAKRVGFTLVELLVVMAEKSKHRRGLRRNATFITAIPAALQALLGNHEPSPRE